MLRLVMKDTHMCQFKRGISGGHHLIIRKSCFLSWSRMTFKGAENEELADRMSSCVSMQQQAMSKCMPLSYSQWPTVSMTAGIP